jgi:hypothetical protein
MRIVVHNLVLHLDVEQTGQPEPQTNAERLALTRALLDEVNAAIGPAAILRRVHGSDVTLCDLEDA